MPFIIALILFITFGLAKATNIDNAKKIPSNKSAQITKKQSKPMLIPPPPPTPSYIGGTRFFSGSIIVNKDDLEMKINELKHAITVKNKDLLDYQTQYQEKNKQAELFTKLFDEGVVSRKELDNCFHDQTRLKEKCQDYVLNIDELNKELAMYQKQFNTLTKSTKITKSTKSNKSAVSKSVSNKNSKTKIDTKKSKCDKSLSDINNIKKSIEQKPQIIIKQEVKESPKPHSNEVSTKSPNSKAETTTKPTDSSK